MSLDPSVIAAGFLCVFAAIMLTGWAVLRSLDGEQRIMSRLRGELANEGNLTQGDVHEGKSSWSFLSKLGTLFVRSDDHRVEDLRTKLKHAGYFHPLAPASFVAIQFLAMLAAGVALGVGFWAFKRGPLVHAFYWGAGGGGAGFLLPSFWLSAAGTKRQRLLKKGMADALDLLVLCMDGGLSFNAAMQMVNDELDAHPELATELAIVHREMQMGLPAGQALRKFADRCGLNDVRDLAAIVLQSENLGAGISKTLRNFADSYRIERQQKAEEMAQKASVKILFPTLLCIFPAIFIVLMGPAAFQLAKLFQR